MAPRKLSPPSNPRLQRTRAAPLRSPLSRELGHIAKGESYVRV
jgi:hypothetical protein